MENSKKLLTSCCHLMFGFVPGVEFIDCEEMDECVVINQLTVSSESKPEITMEIGHEWFPDNGRDLAEKVCLFLGSLDIRRNFIVRDTKDSDDKDGYLIDLGDDVCWYETYEFDRQGVTLNGLKIVMEDA